MSNHYRKKKQKTAAERELDAQSAKLFGKHASAEKRKLLFAAATLACAAPMILGARMWNRIPEIVASGLIGTNGQDDSIPRWMVAFGLPGLMCLLNLLSHFQLHQHQKRMVLPPVHVRLMGRWGFSILSAVFCSGFIRQSVGLQPLPAGFLAPCVLGLLLMLLGAHMFDCPRDSRLSLRFAFTEGSEQSWKKIHRFAGRCWLAVGLAAIAGAMVSETLHPVLAVLVVVALVAPFVYGRLQASQKA